MMKYYVVLEIDEWDEHTARKTAEGIANAAECTLVGTYTSFISAYITAEHSSPTSGLFASLGRQL